MREIARPVNEKEGSVVNADVPVIPEREHESARMFDVVMIRIRLLHQHLACLAEPAARLGLICPRKTKRKVWFAGCQDFGEWPIEQSTAVEPIVPVAESVDSVRRREFGLGRSRI